MSNLALMTTGHTGSYIPYYVLSFLRRGRTENLDCLAWEPGRWRLISKTGNGCFRARLSGCFRTRLSGGEVNGGVTSHINISLREGKRGVVTGGIPPQACF
jgi:hypothetical protein